MEGLNFKETDFSVDGSGMRRSSVSVLAAVLAILCCTGEAIALRQRLAHGVLLGLREELARGGLAAEEVLVMLGERRETAGHLRAKTGRDLLFLKDVWEDLKDKVEDLFAKVTGELGEIFDDDDFDAVLKSAETFLKPEQPFEVRNFTEGLFTGLLSVFMPRLEDSFSGAESMVKIQECFYPRELHANFFAQEALRLRLDRP